MISLGIDIISTPEDLRLFTDLDYNNKVREVVDQLEPDYRTKEHSIACFNDHVALYKNNELVMVREIGDGGLCMENITEEEQELIKAYREADDVTREAVKRIYNV